MSIFIDSYMFWQIYTDIIKVNLIIFFSLFHSLTSNQLSSLPLQIFLFLNIYYAIIFCIAELLLYIYKGTVPFFQRWVKNNTLTNRSYSSVFSLFNTLKAGISRRQDFSKYWELFSYTLQLLFQYLFVPRKPKLKCF